MTVDNETITPKANRRVLDAQLVEDEPTSTSSASFGSYQRKGAHQSQTESASATSKTRNWLPKKFSDYVQLVLGLLVVGLILTLWFKQQNQNWQIEQINQLQTQVVNLSEQQKMLRTQQEMVEQALQAQKEAAQALENKPLVSQADLAEMKQGFADLESQVNNLSAGVQQQAATLLDQAQRKVEEWLATQPKSSVTDEAPIANLQERLQGMAQQLQDLFQFKESQLATPASEPKPLEHLTEMQLQQWILEANVQWLLEGNIAKTQQQLQALEQAAGLSSFAQKDHLMRLIGEDMALLKSMQSNLPINDMPNSTALKVWLRQQAQNQRSVSQGTTQNPVTTPEEVSDVPLSAWQRLQQAFGSVFTLKKRDSEQDLTQVEQVLMQEVVLQRAYLWIEQLDWAMQMASNSHKERALLQLQNFVSQHWPQASQTELASLLQPYEQFTFKTRPALNVVNAL